MTVAQLLLHLTLLNPTSEVKIDFYLEMPNADGEYRGDWVAGALNGVSATVPGSRNQVNDGCVWLQGEEQ